MHSQISVNTQIEKKSLSKINKRGIKTSTYYKILLEYLRHNPARNFHIRRRNILIQHGVMAGIILVVHYLVKQIENDPQIDEEWGEPVKGHVVEIKHEEERVNLADVRRTKKSEATVA